MCTCVDIFVCVTNGMCATINQQTNTQVNLAMLHNARLLIMRHWKGLHIPCFSYAYRARMLTREALQRPAYPVVVLPNNRARYLTCTRVQMHSRATTVYNQVFVSLAVVMLMSNQVSLYLYLCLIVLDSDRCIAIISRLRIRHIGHLLYVCIDKWWSSLICHLLSHKTTNYNTVKLNVQLLQINIDQFSVQSEFIDAHRATLIKNIAHVCPSVVFNFKIKILL